MTRFEDSRIGEVLQAPAEIKTQAIEKFLAKGNCQGPQLFFEAAVHGDDAVLATRFSPRTIHQTCLCMLLAKMAVLKQHRSSPALGLTSIT